MSPEPSIQPTKKSHAPRSMRALHENNSGYGFIVSWVKVMVGMLSIGLLWQRFSISNRAKVTSDAIQVVLIRYEGEPSFYPCELPRLAPLLLGSALMHQTGHSFIGLLGSLPFWMATPAAGQTLDVRTLVPEFRVNSNVTGEQFSPAVANLGAGEWVVVWEGTQGSQTSIEDIYAQLYSTNGSVLGSQFRVNGNMTSSVNNPHVAVASLNTGGWVVVWKGGYDIYAQRYAMNGSLLGSEFRVNNNVTTASFTMAEVVSLGAGEWVVAWEGYQTDNYAIYAQRYAANGSTLGSEFRVSGDMTSNPSEPAAASLGTGDWVVVWQGIQTDKYAIYAQRYGMNGNALGSEFRVGSATIGQLNPAVASLGAGEWVVVWEGYQNGGIDIYAQRYAANGSMLGSEFRVNSNRIDNPGIQANPKVASLSTGEWVVVWGGIQSGDTDIYAQRYGMNGSVLGSEFRVNSNVKGSQSSPNVAGLGTGEWVVVWVGYQAGNDDIYAAIFSSKDHSEKISVSSTGVTPSPTNLGTNTSSGVSGAVIGAAVGVGGVAFAACLSALGFYAYRKKSRAGQANHFAVSEVGASLKPIAQASAQPASQYAKINLKDANQSDNSIPVSHSPYGRIDEMKKQEKEYDHAPTF